MRGEIDQADKILTAALAKNGATTDAALCDVLARARIRVGKVINAYRQMASSDAAVKRLVEICVEEKNAAQLQALIEFCRNEQSDDPRLVGWELKLCWLRNDFAGALKLLTDRRAELGATGFDAELDELKVRSLLKLQRTTDALNEARTIAGRRHRDAFALIFLYAMSGDVQQTLAVADTHPMDNILLRRCYADPDLGPILRSDRFRPFGDKYPKPSDKELDE